MVIFPLLKNLLGGRPHLKINESDLSIKFNNGAEIVTGGRILSVNTYCDSKQEAIDLAYENIRRIKAYKDPELRDEDGS